MSYSVHIKSFEELNNNELFDIMSLRQKVFIVEQNCPYLDSDEKDKSSTHIWFSSNNKIIAYARVVPPGIGYHGYAAIGRVAVDLEFRNQGLGYILMKESIKASKQIYPDFSIKLSAQSYTIPFYNKLGFQTHGEEYLEDDIPHIAMILQHDT